MDLLDLPQIGYQERADFYDIEYKVVDDQAFLRSLVSDQVGSILEVPSGHGRNVDWLLDTNREVSFVDLEPRMIVRVQQQLVRRKRDPRSASVGNMCRLVLGQRFDLILVPREAFQGTLASDAEVHAALLSLQQHLSPTGRICIDLARIEEAPCRRAAPMAYYDPSLPDDVLIAEWTRQHSERGSVRRSRMQHHSRDGVQISFMYALGADNADYAFRFSLNLRRYSKQGFLALAAVAGLKAVAVLGTYESDAYNETHSRMIFLLEHSDGP